MALTRRNLLKSTGAAGAALLTAPGALKGFDQFFRAADPAVAAATKVTTCCGICSPACGLQATVQDGVVKFIEGLPGDAHGEGHLCGKGAAGAGFLYDPDRLKYPMKRTNPRKGFDEDPGWVRISWEEALDTIAAKMKGYVDAYGAESLLFITLPSPDLWSRFMNAMGVVNRVDHIDVCFQTDRVIQKYTTGGKTWCNDFENSKYILLFGWDLVAKAKIVYANGIVKARSKGAKVVHFSPTYTATSRMASEWHNIKPGTDLAVALAMINVIVSENLYNKEFVDAYTNFGAVRDGDPRALRGIHARTGRSRQAACRRPTSARIAREFAATGGGIAPAHKKTLCANYMNGTQLVVRDFDSEHPGGHHRPARRPLLRPRTISVPGVDAVYPPPAYPAKTGRRVDGRDKLPLVQETDTGLFSTLADGMLNKFPGMIKFAFWNAYTILGLPESEEHGRGHEEGGVHGGDGLPAHRYGVHGRHCAALGDVSGNQRCGGARLQREVSAGGPACRGGRADLRDEVRRLRGHRTRQAAVSGLLQDCRRRLDQSEHAAG